jgi:hypothetical protein
VEKLLVLWIVWIALGGCQMRDSPNHHRQKKTIQMDILPKWQASRDFCQIGIPYFLKNPLDDTDLYSILRETRSGTTTMISKKVV